MFLLLLIIYLFQEIPGKELPTLGEIKRPESELRMDIEAPVYGSLKIKMSINANGLITSVELLEAENIPEEKIDYYFKFFKDQLEGRIVQPAKSGGKPIDCIYVYSFGIALYHPPAKTVIAKEIETIEDMTEELKKREAIKWKDIDISPINISSENKILKISTPDGRTMGIEEFRKEINQKANNLFKKEKLRELRRGSVIFLTDSSSQIDDEIYLDALIIIHSIFYNFFKPLIDPNTILPFHNVYIFESKDSYEKFKKFLGVPKWADGNYVGNLKVLSSCSCFEHPLEIRGTLLHEEIHYLEDQVLFKGLSVPKWLNEGMAEFFSLSMIDSHGYMHLGVLDRKIYRHRVSQKLYISPAFFYRDLLLNLKKEKRVGLVENLLNGFLDLDENKSDEEINLFYSMSWAFFNYLAKDNEKVIEFIRQIKNGQEPKESITKLYGALNKIEKDFWKFIKKL